VQCTFSVGCARDIDLDMIAEFLDDGGGSGDLMWYVITLYLVLFVMCVIAVVVAIWLLPQVPVSLMTKVIVKVILALLAFRFGIWLLGRKNL